MRNLYYFYLEFKTAIKCMLGTLIALIAILILSVSLLYAISIAKASYEEALAINVGVVIPEKDQSLNSILKLAESLTSLKGYCSLQSCSESQARDGLRNNTLALAIIIPEDFIDKATHMQPAEFTILAPNELSHNEKKLFSIFHGVEHMMTICESAIQSMYLGMEEFSFDFSIPQMENDLTTIYVNQFMSRGNVFDVEFLSIFGNYSYIEYYSSSLILIILLVCSLSFFGMYGRGELYLEKIFAVKTFGIIKITIMKILAQTLALSLFSYIILLSVYAFDNILRLGLLYVTPGTFLGIFLISLAVSSFTHLIITLFRCSSGASIYYILISLIMVTLSGGIVPKIYFPKALYTFAFFLPFSIWHNATLSSLYETKAASIVILLFNIVFTLSLGIILYVRQVKKHA